MSTAAKPPKRPTISVLIVDDHAVFRSGIAGILATTGHIRVSGETGSGTEAVRLARRLRPQVILMDVRMPGGDGIAATRELAPEGFRIVILTTFDEDDYLFGAIDAGAVGYLLKDASPAEIIAAIEAAVQGSSSISAGLSSRLLREFARRADGVHPQDPSAAVGVLTPREREVVIELCHGRNNAEIAERLGVGAGTVKTHVQRILAKTGFEHRVQIAVWAARNGLIR